MGFRCLCEVRTQVSIKTRIEDEMALRMCRLCDERRAVVGVNQVILPEAVGKDGCCNLRSRLWLSERDENQVLSGVRAIVRNGVFLKRFSL